MYSTAAGTAGIGLGSLGLVGWLGTSSPCAMEVSKIPGSLSLVEEATHSMTTYNEKT